MAEVEHFCDPQDKSHPRYETVKDIEIRLLSARTQSEGSTQTTRITLEKTLQEGIVGNQTLAYFIGRVYLFLQAIGIDPERLRFREHMANEQAHYASGCFDAEIEMNGNYVECVGIADRSVLAQNLARTLKLYKIRLRLERAQ